MIDYKSATGSDALLERVSSANNIEGSISLTWLWEVIVRTRRLPDDLDPSVLFIVLRDRLRNPEREVRQHALRVLSDLIPVVEQQLLDKHMELLLPDLIVNLSHVAPAVRKGVVDVFRVHIKYSPMPNEVLRKLISAVPQDSHLMLGLLMAAPYFVSSSRINEDTLIFLMRQLSDGLHQEALKEAALSSLAKIRSKLGVDRFNLLLGSEAGAEFLDMCKEHNVVLEAPKVTDDNVILETEITLETGPAITMQIHEESSKHSDELIRRSKRPVVRMMTSESDSDVAPRSPRKVHFGGEVVKMRTPESDSNQTSDENDMQTSVVIDRPTSIKITLSDNVAAIRTRHKSLIPVRITTGGSNPSTPRKKLPTKKRLHKSAPELRRNGNSKIPLPHSNGTSVGSMSKSDSNLYGDKNGTNPAKSEPPPSETKESDATTVQVQDKLQTPPLNPVRRTSPIPVHNGVEMLHNLTRSPVHQEQVNTDQHGYSSFQVYRDEDKGQKEAQKDRLSDFIEALSQKEDIWKKSNSLDDFITLLHNDPSCVNSSNLPALLQTLFVCERNHRLQNLVQEAIKLIFLSADEQSLTASVDALAKGLSKMGQPNGVKLSLMAMQKISPRKFLKSLNGGLGGEKMLQVLIAATRTFPSSEINVNEGVAMAFEAMKDPKRATRQAALEALASLAQVAGNTAILEAVADLTSKEQNYDHLLRIVRTRLSRKQLPTLDLNGNIRYSSPREQEEFDWLCGGSVSIRKAMSLTSIKISPNNYWKHNLRHDLDAPLSSSSYAHSLDVSEASNEESSSATNKDQIWTGTGATEKAALYPVYVLHRDNQQDGKSYRHFDRGRSNSPPQNRHPDFSLDPSNRKRDKARKFFRHHDQFRKSFSSEHIYNGNVHRQEPTSFSLSSRSSTTSTGSSTRSGLWLKSGIPVPINSSDSKLKLRYSRHPADTYAGPLVAQEVINRTKVDSPEPSPVIIRNSPQQVQLPPPSSGSESSGYFTPPPDHHLKDQPLERYPSEDTFEDNNNEEEPNFQIVDSEASDVPDRADQVQRLSSASSAAVSEEPPPLASHKQDHAEECNLEDFDFDEDRRIFANPRNKSKSEANLDTLPAIERKNINSAPPLNEVLVPYRFEEVAQSPVNTSLPGSVVSNEPSPVKTQTSGVPIRRLSKRSTGSRSSSLGRNHASPRLDDLKPFSRPKEALHQSLTQMDSVDWETVMQGLSGLTRLARNHPDILESQMHPVCMALAKNIKNLRSQVARSACRAASEIFSTCKKGLEMELEELAGPLLQRTADTNKFLRSDANSALDVMSLNMSIPRVVAVVANKGSTHQNCVVRAAATRLLSDIAGRIGYDRVLQLPKETRDKFVLIGANGLTEGSLENRKHAKTLIGTLMRHPNFQKFLVEAVPQHTLRHISKAIGALK